MKNDEAARQGRPDTTTAALTGDSSSDRGRKPTAAALLTVDGALLTRGHLRELGLERRGVDAVFKACPVVVLAGYSRPMIRVADYLALLARSTYTGDRVRP